MHLLAVFLEDVAVPDWNAIGIGVFALVVVLVTPAAFAAAAIFPAMAAVQMEEGHFVRSESVSAVCGWSPYLLSEAASYTPFSFVRESVLKKQSLSRSTRYFEEIGF